MNCKVCNKRMDSQEDNETFVHRCNHCSLTHLKTSVKDIINTFSGNDMYRYTKLLILDIVNTLPINDLYEMYIIAKDPFTVDQFNSLLERYKNAKT